MTEARKIVYVRWIDSAGYSGWRPASVVAVEPMTIQSIGFLLNDADDFVTIALSLGLEKDPMAGDQLCIPRMAILDLWEVSGVL